MTTMTRSSFSLFGATGRARQQLRLSALYVRIPPSGYRDLFRRTPECTTEVCYSSFSVVKCPVAMPMFESN